MDESKQNPIRANRTFQEVLHHQKIKLPRQALETLQINLGLFCNQACLHCHVEAGPNRGEQMNEATAIRIIELLKRSPGISSVDLTGGAPELNPNFRKLVLESKALGKKVMDRCNLTVFWEAGQEDMPEFLKEQHVKIIASLPCYSKENVDQQRGEGVFQKSIEALRMLNRLGYGKADSALELDLIYNPLGPFLPPDQNQLEATYRMELLENFGIVFNHLYTITNMPIKRFKWDLIRQHKLSEYISLLVNHFNPRAAEAVMCRSLISISWDGKIYDCDFNQMLGLPLGGFAKSLWDISCFDELSSQEIFFGDHCFGCTAGSGSSCGGATVN